MPLGLGSYRVDYRKRGAKKWHKWGDYLYKDMAEAVAKRRSDADYEARVV